MFSVGDKVRCVRDDDSRGSLVVGAVYEVLNTTLLSLLVCVRGSPQAWQASRFELVESWRVTTTAAKPTNPKDMIGATKLPLNLVPDTLVMYACMAYLEGAVKYGAYNWRVAGVRFSIYVAAARRHEKKLWNGEWADPVTKVPHIASIIACWGIIADARECGKLLDDRPPKADMGRLIAECEEVTTHVAKLFEDKRPHHHTQLDQEHAKCAQPS